MGADIIGAHTAADALIDQAGDWLGYSIPAVCLEGSGRKAVPSRIEAQVIYAIDCAYTAVIKDQGKQPTVVAGHSLGGFAAAFAAEVFDFLPGLQLVSALETLMEDSIDAAGPIRQAMAAIIGLPESTVTALCQSQADTHLANQNSNGQYVVAGPEQEVERVMESATKAGAVKVKRLPATRAMHTPHLADVSRQFARHLSSVELRDPSVAFLNCESGALLRSADAVRTYLSAFLCRPVRWESAMRTLREQGMSSFVEVGPATVLADLMRFIDRSATVRPASEVLWEVTPR